MGKVGWMIKCKEGLRISRYENNNHVELIAIEQALVVANRQTTAGENAVKVFTDSQRALIWIQGGTAHTVLTETVKSIYKLTDELTGKGCAVELHWVKEHNGNLGNVKADQLAAAVRVNFDRVIKTTNEVTVWQLPEILEGDALVEDGMWNAHWNDDQVGVAWICHTMEAESLQVADTPYPALCRRAGQSRATPRDRQFTLDESDLSD
ncbi:hypothetical protein BKA67DRAFT_645449 [Truncatella angustata]|uniref:RNase H type-1 domain-containing protein n=1 Tax=Truncatella angustata TaxID=152316 RepID=A0A9P8UPR0_9PEZI|nr:uncharacterized protein BKA67DRAFT_645449 [Truncatella angustata]KAH6656055.1 hypothetical protein BKA67DRAFT_645449 [Truncatella angustata]